VLQYSIVVLRWFWRLVEAPQELNDQVCAVNMRSTRALRVVGDVISACVRPVSVLWITC
jgi:hypothetical protein